MTVRDIKKVLEEFPEDAHIVIANDSARACKFEVNRVGVDWTGAVVVYNGEPCDTLFKIAKAVNDL
jgi:hypothetical protein